MTTRTARPGASNAALPSAVPAMPEIAARPRQAYGAAGGKVLGIDRLKPRMDIRARARERCSVDVRGRIAGGRHDELVVRGRSRRKRAPHAVGAGGPAVHGRSTSLAAGRIDLVDLDRGTGEPDVGGSAVDVSAHDTVQHGSGLG